MYLFVFFVLIACVCLFFSVRHFCIDDADGDYTIHVSAKGVKNGKLATEITVNTKCHLSMFEGNRRRRYQRWPSQKCNANQMVFIQLATNYYSIIENGRLFDGVFDLCYCTIDNCSAKNQLENAQRNLKRR